MLQTMLDMQIKSYRVDSRAKSNVVAIVIKAIVVNCLFFF